MQNYLSANTSINKVKLPTIYNKVKFEPGSVILDYGCGKYIDHIREKVESQGCTYVPYDLNHYPKQIPNINYDYCIISNVLNVIDDLATIKSIINVCTIIAKTVYITVYEGDKSGCGKVTKKDCYQRNEPIKKYVEYIKDFGFDPIVKNNVITIKK